MFALGAFQSFYYCHFASPRSDRVLYRAVRRSGASRILELGMGTGRRAARLIRMAQHHDQPGAVRYVGLDPFEARTASDGPGMSLKLAYRMLRATGARVQLLPGEPLAVLAQAANSLGPVDLVIFSARLDPRLLAETWYYVPRLLHSESEVYVETELPGNGRSLRCVEPGEIAALVSTRRRAA